MITSNVLYAYNTCTVNVLIMMTMCGENIKLMYNCSLVSTTTIQ